LPTGIHKRFHVHFRKGKSVVRLARISAIVLAVTGMVAATVIVPTAAVAAENSTLQCTSSAPIYRITSTGDLYLYQFNEPENGTDLSFQPNPPRIGLSWTLGRPVGALDGNLFMAWNSDGALRRYRWNGTAWDTFAGGAQHEIVEPSGWERYNTAEYKNRITVDAEGHIYTVEPDGNLHWRAYDPTTHTMRHRVLGDGWGQFNLITAGGKGVIYARTPAGLLYRYRYNADAQRWLMYGRQVGAGWQIFDRVFSSGGDVLYGVQPDQRMFWYRWDENTEAWISNTGRQIGAGWNDWTTTAVPNACQRVGTSVPVRPSFPAQPHGAVTLLNTSDGHVHLSYVDPEGRAAHGEAADLTGNTPIGISVIPGLTGVTATTAMSEYSDGRVLLSANGTDTDLRETVRSTNDVWDTPSPGGGFMATAPASTRLTGNLVASFALDGNYSLWMRKQLTANGPLGAWWPVGGTPLAHQRLTVVPTSAGVRIIGLGRDGRFQTATYENLTLSPWTTLGGSTFTGTASVVVMPDGTLQVFATNSAGEVQTTRQTTSGFPGTWTTLSGLTAAGSPSAIMAPDGTLQVVARGTDNYPYYAGQPTPGATTYGPWRTITTSEETSTDPTALAVPSASTWVVSYVNDLDVPKLRRYQPPVPARAASPFAEVPLA
jgi:hypothetical protein